MRKVKRFFTIFFLIVILLVALAAFQNYPANSQPKQLTSLSDTTKIKQCLNLIINTPRPRNVLHVDMLDTVASRINAEFIKYANNVYYQPYYDDGKQFKNVIASFGPPNAKRIIVGAHYDVCGEQEGADDNASGVAGLLELARLLHNTPLNHRIDLVAYSTEEPPYFGTHNMGSYIHAKSLSDSSIPVFGMVSIEMIGYYTDIPQSQHYPIGMLKWFYGDKGDFITIVQQSFRGKFARQYKRAAFKNNSISTKAFTAPSFFGGISLSDHRNYWHFGYSAIMITNTSFFRNRNYHQRSDRIETLDINRMGLTIDGIYRTLVALQ